MTVTTVLKAGPKLVNWSSSERRDTVDRRIMVMKGDWEESQKNKHSGNL